MWPHITVRCSTIAAHTKSGRQQAGRQAHARTTSSQRRGTLNLAAVVAQAGDEGGEPSRELELLRVSHSAFEPRLARWMLLLSRCWCWWRWRLRGMDFSAAISVRVPWWWWRWWWFSRVSPCVCGASSTGYSRSLTLIFGFQSRSVRVIREIHTGV